MVRGLKPELSKRSYWVYNWIYAQLDLEIKLLSNIDSIAHCFNSEVLLMSIGCPFRPIIKQVWRWKIVWGEPRLKFLSKNSLQVNPSNCRKIYLFNQTTKIWSLGLYSRIYYGLQVFLNVDITANEKKSFMPKIIYNEILRSEQLL